MDKTEESGNRRFSLLSALNGLFERARSSAEKESQRLFTSPLASTATTASVGEPGDPTYGSPRKRSNTRPLLADSVARTKMRPRPARTAPDTRALSARRPSETEPRPASVVSDRTKLATTVDLMSIVAASERSDDATSAGMLSTPGSRLKRKHSVLHSTSSSPVSAVPSTAAIRSVRADSSLGDASPKRARPAESTHTVESPALDGALHMPALISGSGESTATAHSVTPQEIHNMRPPETRPSLGTKRKAVGFEGDKGPAVVERSRLEKVERELRQLKRIIASLVPGELNDDDLRSVYGELDIGRQSSEDVLSRLMRIRAGAASSHADAIHSAMPKPLRSAMPPPPPPPPPPPLPSPPFSALARDSKAAASAAAAARAQLSLPPPPHFSGTTSRKQPPINSPESAQQAEHPPRPSAATVQRLRADLRPVSSPKPSASKPTPPHKDPNVMSQMLHEMKTHKLRSVKKPKDMEAALPKRQRH